MPEGASSHERLPRVCLPRAVRSPTRHAIIDKGDEMKDAWIAAAGFVLGWLMSKTWQDPACRVGLVLFVVATAVMALVFALAVVGHGRSANAPPDDGRDDP